MATKKKTDVVEEVKEAIEAPVEEAPKKTTKKTSKKKEEAPIVEEPIVEEAPATEEVVEEPAPVVEEVKVAEPKKEEKKAEKKEEKEEAFAPYIVQVISPSGIYTFKNPGFDQPKGKVYPKGAKVKVLEVKGNWAKVSENAWILLSGAVVKV